MPARLLLRRDVEGRAALLVIEELLAAQPHNAVRAGAGHVLARIVEEAARVVAVIGHKRQLVASRPAKPLTLFRRERLTPCLAKAANRLAQILRGPLQVGVELGVN